MPAVLTESSDLRCSHGGKILAKPGSRTLVVGKAAVLVRADLKDAAVAGCPVSPSPCLTVTSVTAGLATTLKVGEEPVLLATAQGVTSSGTWSVADAAQDKLEAT
ncbi:hypothetical protein [Actinomadura fibrosa]|uniref:Uncharacterized protein n=1 Tax=Actinomadura fibrosa TaxID=111802 RepID=A0ABW2XSF3_9ACTN|nr:hypothetical protein [Actinomadura fibrosa]